MIRKLLNINLVFSFGVLNIFCDCILNISFFIYELDFSGKFSREVNILVYMSVFLFKMENIFCVFGRYCFCCYLLWLSIGFIGGYGYLFRCNLGLFVRWYNIYYLKFGNIWIVLSFESDFFVK